jgi:hypothetical protein
MHSLYVIDERTRHMQDDLQYLRARIDDIAAAGAANP